MTRVVRADSQQRAISTMEQLPTAGLYTAAPRQDVIRALFGAFFDVQFRHRSNPPMRVRTKLILPKSMHPPHI